MIKRITLSVLFLILCPTSSWAQMSERDLSSYAQNIQNSVSSRADAVVLLGQYSGQNALIAIARASRDRDPNLRLAAIQAVQHWQGVAQWDVVSPLLNDSNTKVQAYAGRILIMLWRELDKSQQDRVTQAVVIYLKQAKAQLSEYDYAMEEALIYSYMYKYPLAIKAIKQAQQSQPTEEQPYIYLSEIYRYMGKDTKSIDILKQGVDIFPQSAEMHYLLGLAYVRKSDSQKALLYFKKAIQFKPSSEQYQLAYAMMLFKQDAKKGIEKTKSLSQQAPMNFRYLSLLCEMYNEINESAHLHDCFEKLDKIASSDVVNTLEK